MELTILIIGLKKYNEKELDEIISLAKDDYQLMRLPSNEHYLICAVNEIEVEEIRADLEEISRSHSNPAWEIQTRNINSQSDLELLPTILFYEPK